MRCRDQCRDSATRLSFSVNISREMKRETAALTGGLTAVDIVLPGTSFPFLDHLPKLLLVVTALRTPFLIAGSDHVAAVCLHPIVASVKVRRVGNCRLLLASAGVAPQAHIYTCILSVQDLFYEIDKVSVQCRCCVEEKKGPKKIASL